MIKFRPQAREYQSDTFLLNTGIDSMNDPVLLGKGKVVDMLNMDIADYGPFSRAGLTILGGSVNSAVIGEGVIMRDDGDILVRVEGTKFQKLVGASWVDVKTVTAVVPHIVSYNCSDLTTAAVLSGTATADSSQLTLVVNGGSMDINAHATRVLRLTGGTGAGQELLITGNDLVQIFVQSSFDTIPDKTTTFEIRETRSHVVFSNGIDTPFKYDGTTLTDLTAWRKYTTLEVAHDRLWGARDDQDRVYLSNLGTDYFPKENYLQVNENGDSIKKVALSHDEVIVYKRNSKYRIIGYDIDSFQLVTADEKIGCIAPMSVAHGNNYNFYLGYGGVFSIQSLNNSTTDEAIPISKDISNKILAHSAAELEASVGWIHENKYHLAVGNEVFVYHIAQSYQMSSQVWTRYIYADNIKSALVFNGTVYLGGKQSYTVEGTTDYGTAITCKIETADRIVGDKNRYKIYHRDLVTFTPGVPVQVRISVDKGAWENLGTFTANTEGQFKIVVNRRGKRIRYEHTFTGTGVEEMTEHEQFFGYTTKAI